MSDHPSFQAWLSGITDLKFVLAQYQGAVTYVDDEFGRLLDNLERRHILSRTAIVLTADHGESLGEHGMYFVHTGLYDPTTHIPLLTWFPGDGRHGIQVRDIVESVDIFPTLLEYMGLTPPEGIRGRSLWPLMRGGSLPPKDAYIEHAGHNLVALRSDRYAYVKHLRTAYIQPSYPFTSGREELYDVHDDPEQLHDLSRDRPDLIAQFRAALEQRRHGRLDLAPGKAEVTPETTDVLRSLGYVQ
jgi:arylsulfatase A-like enzyme